MNGSDRAFLERWITRRDADAFRSIVLCYSSMVYGTCRRLLQNPTDAEDATQECFEVLAQTRRLPNKESLGPWLHGVATRQSLQRLRSDTRRRIRETRYARENDSRVQGDWDDVYQYVDEAIAELPEKLRAPVIAYYLVGKSQTEIARACGITQQAVSYRISKGVEQVGSLLKKRGVIVATAILSTLLSANLASAMSPPASLAASLGKLGLVHSAKSAVTATVSHAGSAGVLGGVLTMKTGSIFIAVAIFISAPWLLAQLKNDGPGDVRIGEDTRERTTPAEIIRAYADTFNAQRHFAFRFSGSKYVDYQNWTPRGTRLPRFRTWYMSGELASDGTRVAHRSKRWGQIGIYDVEEKDADYRRRTFDGEENWGYSVARFPGAPDAYPHGVLGIDTDMNKLHHQEILSGEEPIRNLLGYTSWTSGNGQIKNYLDNANVLSVRPDNESINGTECVVIDFKSILGSGTIWFAPEYGYNVAKADIVESPGDVLVLSRGTRRHEGHYNRYLFHDVSFERIDGVWFPTSMTSRVELSGIGWKEVDIIQCEVSDIRLNPDLDALGVFSKADIEEGAVAGYVGTSLQYKWLGGRLVPVR